MSKIIFVSIVALFLTGCGNLTKTMLIFNNSDNTEKIALNTNHVVSYHRNLKTGSLTLHTVTGAFYTFPKNSPAEKYFSKEFGLNK